MAHATSNGYAIESVLDKRGRFNLCPLIVGSQGTLGLVVEADITLESYNPKHSTVAVYCDSLEKLQLLATAITKIDPFVCETIDVDTMNAETLATSKLAKLFELGGESKGYITVISFDEDSPRSRKKYINMISEFVESKSMKKCLIVDKELQKRAITEATLGYVSENEEELRVPIIEDSKIPVAHVAELIKYVNELAQTYQISCLVGGRINQGVIKFLPILKDYKDSSARVRLMELTKLFYKKVHDLGGSASTHHNEGRLRAIFAESNRSADERELFMAIKRVFDPKNQLNPGVKVGVDPKKVLSAIRSDYNNDKWHEFLPKI